MRLARLAVLAIAVVGVTVRLKADPTYAQPAVTFNDAAPIIWARCATCHRDGQVAPFSLVTYADVKRHAAQIADVTARRVMPPWKPLPGHGEFENPRRLTDHELRVLQEWIANGAIEGNPSDLPSVPSWTKGWQLGTPDLVVTMPQPYTVRADGDGGRDVFRTFVVPIPTQTVRYVRALEVRPDNARVVHHANLGVDRTRSSRQLDARDGEPGYAGSMVPDAQHPEGQLLGWTPGQTPHAAAPGLQWRLDPDSDLVLQLHLQPTGKPEAVAVSVGFFFASDPPSRTPVGLRLGSETIDIPPGDARFVIEDRYVLPVDVEVVAIQPHAHNLARRMEASATQPDGRREALIAIDDWDFRWQDVYRYARPIALAKGTTIAMRYTYDNSAHNVRNPHQPPARVVWGQNTTDEMGDLWIQAVPRTAADAETLRRDFRRKAHAEDLAAYTRLLAADPRNPLRHDAVASLYFDAGQVDLSIEHYRRSLQLNPSSASTHYNIGISYATSGRRADAIAHFEDAIRLDPEYAQAHNNLGALLQLQGRTADALTHYRTAVALRPDSVEARANLGQLLSSQQQARAAVEQFRAVLALRDDHPQALAGLAWIEATTEDPSLRNPEEAVRLAERASASTGRRDLSVLDALAAAYAAVGRFDEAVEAAKAGVELALSQGLSDHAARMRERLALYLQHRSYRFP